MHLELKYTTNKMVFVLHSFTNTFADYKFINLIVSLITLSSSTMSETTIISDPLEVGTRVHWDASTQSLYYVDVPLSQLYKYQPSTGVTTKTTVGNEPLGFAFPVKGDDTKFIAAVGRKFVIIKWNGTSANISGTELIGEVDSEIATNRLNGGKVDPFGRLWAGTMGGTDSNGETIPGKGSLFSVTKGVIKKHDSNIGISNGLAWNVALKKMYYIDTLFNGIYQYDYDPPTGNIGNKTVIFKFDDHKIEGSPDGLTIDTDGNIWVAMIYGSAIVQVNPRNGQLIKTVEMPTPQVTAVSFGNQNLDTMYVNTAKMSVKGKVPPHPAGCTFSVEKLGVKGLPGDRYDP